MQLNDELQFQTVFVNKRKEIPLYSAWVARDFGDRKYKGKINAKGLRTFSNYPKDVYFLYKAFLSPAPVLHIVGPHHFLRVQNRTVKIYSNAPSVTLAVNGTNLGMKRNGEYRHANGVVINNVFAWEGALRPGRNSVVASTSPGRKEQALLYFSPDGRPGSMPEDSGLVANLHSASTKNTPHFIDIPAQNQWGFYSDFDGNGDNTFDVLPNELAGAGWISTRRQSDRPQASSITFSLLADADVFVMTNKDDADGVLPAGRFQSTGVAGRWRNKCFGWACSSFC